MLRRLLRKPIARALLLAAACFLAITPFFWWGSPSGHDFEFHMDSWMEVLSQWQHGILYPRWAALAHWGYGEARFLFYPPLSWTLGAALGAVLPWKMVPGAYCWIALLLAGAGMYRLARNWFAPADALFAAVFYALNPYHLLILYWRSAYAELLAAALLPLLLACVLRMNEPGWRPTLWLSLLLAVAWLMNAPAAVMIHYSTAGLVLVFAAVQAAHEGSLSPERRSPGVRILLRPLPRTALAVLLGAALASFYLLPAIYEQKWIDFGQILSLGVRPQDNFLFTTLADPDHNRFNLLVSTIALAEIAVLALAIWGSRHWHAKRADAEIADNILWILLSAWGIATVFLMLSVSSLLWQYLPELRFVQLPFRWLLCLNAALAILLSMMAVHRSALTSTWILRLLASAVLLAAVILAGHRFQPPWWETASDVREMTDAFADGSGYEGTDEYVPAGVDPYELNKDLPLISDASGAQVPNQMVAWGPSEKHFTVRAAAAENVIVHQFNYPAWEVVVNGKPIRTGKTDVTGLIVIPIAPGDNDIRIHFRRTIDRSVGNAVSLIGLAVFAVAWMKTKSQ